MDQQSKSALDKATQLIKQADNVIIDRLAELRTQGRRAEMQELVDAHSRRPSMAQHIDVLARMIDWDKSAKIDSAQVFEEVDRQRESGQLAEAIKDDNSTVYGLDSDGNLVKSPGHKKRDL